MSEITETKPVTALNPLKPILELVMNAGKNGMEFEEREYKCTICRDTGMMEIQRGEYQGRPCFGLVPCNCRRQKIFRERFSTVVRNTPKEYFYLTDGMKSLKPDNSRHPKQAAVISRISEKPDDSYLFFGVSGSGKSVISWALAQSAALAGKQVFCGTAEILIASFRTWQIYDRRIENCELYSLEQLVGNGDRWLILIDEIEKVKLSDYTLRTLFTIIKTAIENGHQLVITANRTLEEIEDRWIALDGDGKLDAENYASAIRRRLNECCVPVDMRLFECENGHVSAVGQERKCTECGGNLAKWLR